MALNSYFALTGIKLRVLTIVIGHATFCVVVVYNNVIARLRRVPGSLSEASMDLGASGLQTFRYVTLPRISTALVSGGLLAFALSFDEVIVTTFTAGAQNTLPMLDLRPDPPRTAAPRGERHRDGLSSWRLTIIPVALAAKVAGSGGVTMGARGAAALQQEGR